MRCQRDGCSQSIPETRKRYCSHACSRAASEFGHAACVDCQFPVWKKSTRCHDCNYRHQSVTQAGRPVKPEDREKMAQAARERYGKARGYVMTPEIVAQLRARVEAGEDRKALAAEYRIGKATVNLLMNWDSWAQYKEARQRRKRA